MGSFAATHFTFHQGFDSVGNRTELRAVHGTSNDFRNTYTYDKLRRLTEVTQSSQPGGNAVLPKRVALEYNALGQRTKISRFESTGTTNAVATTDFTYDFANRLSSIAHKKGTTNLNTHSYTYDPLSRLRSITSTLDGTINYTYDQRSQLTIADDGQPYSPGHPTRLGERYQYDANGNREGTGFTVLPDNDNRITAAPGETYTYDNEGNVISMITSIGVGSKSFQWDHRNRLIQSTVNTSSGIVTVNYAYDPFNRLVKRSTGFNTTYFGYDEGINPQLQMDTQSSNQITHRYLWSDQVDELFADEQRLSGLVPDTKWALSDHQLTIKDIADFNSSTGQTSIRHRAYDSFGNRKGSALPTDIVFGYTGKYFDETTGMQNSWNRWYSPKMGRFISQDPIGFAAGDANLYRYVGNSPTLATDPSGLFGVGHHWITMSKLLGVADKFEKDALYVLIGAYSGLLENAHNRRRMDGISHSEYDKAIEQSLRDFLDARQGKGKVTPKEAKQFAQDVYEGKVFNKTNAASVKKFNTQVVKELRDKEGFLEPRDTPTERLIKQGKSYAQTDRGKEIMRAGKFLGILGGILSAAQMVEMAEASTSPLSAVFRSIAAGDYAGAERGLIGENAGSLISVLREKDPRFIYGEALFKEKVQTMISEIKDWDERFLNEK